MKQLANKHVLLCVTGGIAAYKAAEIIRLFKTSGSNVRVLMTSAAKEFITPLTMQALSGNQVHTDLLDTDAEAAMGHIELAKWSDIVLIAPCSANSIARLASGKGDDLMTAVCLAAECKIYFAPAMNQAMWSDSRTQNNHKKLLENKFIPIGPNSGEQACGDEGYGRMSEPQEIVNNIASGFSEGLLAGKKILITAGPTREKIDPVRFISNRSSGKMGFSIAEAARDEGGLVSLISGPVSLETPNEIKRINVESADEMLSEVDKVINDFDLFISTAAVSDYKPEEYEVQKIKKEKNTDNLNLELITNKDILKHVSKDKGDLKVIGFAAETQNIIENAKRKLNEKNLDLIIANDVSDPSIGFDSDDKMSEGEVGRVGVPISTLDNIESLFQGIPLEKVSTSMTINSTAAILLSFYIVNAEKTGVPLNKLRGTIQNDILKEFAARGTYIYPPKPSMRIVTNILEFCDQNLPKWNPISISGYHIREAGSTVEQELAFTFANGIAYVENAIKEGLDPNKLGKTISFFFNSHNGFIEEISKFRAARKMWATIMKERFGVTDDKAMMCRFHTQTGGSTLTSEQPDNNIVRTTIQALSAVLGGTQSLHTNSFDEALSLPSDDSAKLALRTQQNIAQDTNIPN